MIMAFNARCCSVYLVVLILLAILAIVTLGQSDTTKSTTTTLVTPSAAPTTNTTAQVCGDYHSCDTCVHAKKASCVWCSDVKACRKALSYGLLELGKICAGGLGDASWATCAVNMLALIIGMGVVGGIILISLVVCCCCCCCCKNSAKSKLKWLRQDMKTQQQREERKAQYAERRAERQVKNDEIRRKYGLFKDDKGGYQRFDEA